MITNEILAYNLKVLRDKIPTKPNVYTPEHPKRISEALEFYCNQRTVHIVQAYTYSFNENYWPLPLWFNPEDVRVGFWNKLYFRKHIRFWNKNKKFCKLKEFDFLYVLAFNCLRKKSFYNEIIVEAFDVNKKYTFQMLLSNPILDSKKEIIESIQLSYNKGNWVACICTIFPLIDFVTRNLLKTSKLSIDVSNICKLFDKNGFTLDNAIDLMPHISYVISCTPDDFFNGENLKKLRKNSETDFGLIGPALCSFIKFANTYYSYFKDDNEVNNGQLLNRHAILHGSINNFGTKDNTVKLITFLFLMLELESIFAILFIE